MPFQQSKDREISSHYLVEIWGREKSSKTSWALTAPVPLYVYNFDQGFDRVQQNMLTRSATIPIDPPFAERHAKGLVLVSDYHGLIQAPMQQGKEQVGGLRAEDIKNAEEVLNQFEEDWFAMVKNETMKKFSLPAGGTAIVDTGSLIWLMSGHVLQRKAPPNQSWIQYTMRNDYWRRLLFSARESGRNVIFIHHDTDIYGSEGSITGQKAQGDKLVSRAADVIVRLRSVKSGTPGVPLFKLTIEDCGLNAEATGQELHNSTWDDLIEAIVA